MLQRRQKSKIYQRLSRFSATFKTIYYNIKKKKFEAEAWVLNKFIHSGSVCFDVGANYGKYTFMMSKLVGTEGRVYSFEPVDYSYKVLSNIVKFHRLKNVALIKKALTDKTGTADIGIPIKDSGKLGKGLAYLSSGADPNLVFEEVETSTLDDYCSNNNIPNIDFIKCDVEGAELLVFRGAKNSIERNCPTVLSEVNIEFLFNRFNSTPSEFYDFFSDRGYKTFVLEENKFEKVDKILENNNYFFIHNSKLKNIDLSQDIFSKQTLYKD